MLLWLLVCGAGGAGVQASTFNTAWAHSVNKYVPPSGDRSV